MNWINELTHWHWLILSVILITLEMLVPGAYLLWMGCAAIVLAGVMYIFPGMSFLLQILLFAVLGVAVVMLYRAYKNKHPVVTYEPALNRRGEQYIGRILVLTEAIIDGYGKAKVDDSVWKVSGEDSPAGASVRVVAIEGSVLVVEPFSATDQEDR